MRVVRALIRWTVDYEGSTRSVALMRIGLALIAWARYAEELSFHRHLEWDFSMVGASFFVSSTLMLFGVCSRFSTAWTGATLLFGTYAHLGFQRGIEPWTHHHTYLLCIATCLLALTPCGGSYSWDRWRAVVRAEREGRAAPPEYGPLWAQRLIALQVATVYFWAAFNKTSVAFLDGSALEFVAMSLYLGSDYPQSPLFHATTVFLAWATVTLEYALAFGLFVQRLRVWLVPAGMVFHAIIYMTLPVATFSVTMWILYLAFLDPDQVHAFLDRIGTGLHVDPHRGRS
jgi:hypothetical protein